MAQKADVSLPRLLRETAMKWSKFPAPCTKKRVSYLRILVRCCASEHLVFPFEALELLTQPRFQIRPDLLCVSVIVCCIFFAMMPCGDWHAAVAMVSANGGRNVSILLFDDT